MGYTKLFNEIVLSTVWQQPVPIKIVWVTMLALKDRWHVVNASIPGLADIAGVSIADCEKALDYLMSPDPYSRTKDKEGRRIEKVDGGWFILNGEKYRQKMSLDERREYNRIKQREYYHNKRVCNSSVLDSTNHPASVDITRSKVPEAESDTDIRNKNNIAHPKMSEWFSLFWNEYPRKIGKKKSDQIFKRQDFSEEKFLSVMAALRQQKESEQWNKDNGQFIPHPATWLSQERWNDEVIKREDWKSKFLKETEKYDQR